MSAPVVRLQSVTVRYGSRIAVGNVDLEVPAGRITAIVGPSGCGKTTLLYAINRLHELVPGAVVSGRITVGVVPTSEMQPDELRRSVGLILQRPVPFPMSIRENIAFPLRRHGTASSEIADRVQMALQEAALWPEVHDRLDSSPQTLSGGQQQRLCLARALALRPGVLLLDEPCASLDPAATARVEEALVALEGRTTLVLVTHNLAQARRLAARCACLWPDPAGGKLVDCGPTPRIFESPATDELRAWFSGAIG
jgi:phosphate transport system ATP-binding protein